jgi:hypothetical protein
VLAATAAALLLPLRAVAWMHARSQVAWGLARLRCKAPECLEAIVRRGKHLLHQHQHEARLHQHRHAHAAQAAAGEAAAAAAAAAGAAAAPLAAQGGDNSQQQQQQQQELAERTAAVLSWAVSALNQPQLAREVGELLRASGIKQQAAPLHPANARLLWAVHAWLCRLHASGHKGAGVGVLGQGQGGLERLLTQQQLRECAAASRHVAGRTAAGHGSRLLSYV